jgi:hypothetical protein
LSGTTLANEIHNLKSWYFYLYSAIARHASHLPFGLEYEDFAKMMSIVRSRCWVEDAHSLVLYPVVDIFNHDCSFDPDSKVFAKRSNKEQILALRDYGKGEHVCITYGLLCNEKLLSKFGFVPQNNPNDFVPVSVEKGTVRGDEEDIYAMEEKKEKKIIRCFGDKIKFKMEFEKDISLAPMLKHKIERMLKNQVSLPAGGEDVSENIQNAIRLQESQHSILKDVIKWLD